MTDDISALTMEEAEEAAAEIADTIGRIVRQCSEKGHDLCPRQIDEIARALCEDYGFEFGGVGFVNAYSEVH